MTNTTEIMTRAWEIKKAHEERMTMNTALKLAWGEAKGMKLYTVNVENLRAQISSYLVKLTRDENRDEHGDHKLEALRAALMAPVDELGVAVLDGKTVGLCKYAVRCA